MRPCIACSVVRLLFRCLIKQLLLGALRRPVVDMRVDDCHKYDKMLLLPENNRTTVQKI